MKKGFTLIELLAVIIILAVIALIATPLILDVVSDAEEESRLQTVNGYIEATRMYISEAMIKDLSLEGNLFDTIKDRVKGTKPETGEIFVGVWNKIAVALKVDGYCYIKQFDDVQAQRSNNEECSLGTTSNEVTYEVNAPTYEINQEKCLAYYKTKYPSHTDEMITGMCDGTIPGEGISLPFALKNGFSNNPVVNIAELKAAEVITDATTNQKLTCVVKEKMIESYEVDVETCKTYLSKYDMTMYLTESDREAYCAPNQDSEMGSLKDLFNISYAYVEAAIKTGVIKNVVYSDDYIITGYRCYEGNDFGLPIENPVILNDVVEFDTYAFTMRGINYIDFSQATKLEHIKQFSVTQNNIETLDLSNATNLTKIGTNAFAANKLKTIKLPENLTTVETNALASTEENITITINQYEGSIEGAPWGAGDATINWLPCEGGVINELISYKIDKQKCIYKYTEMFSQTDFTISDEEIAAFCSGTGKLLGAVTFDMDLRSGNIPSYAEEGIIYDLVYKNKCQSCFETYDVILSYDIDETVCQTVIGSLGFSAEDIEIVCSGSGSGSTGGSISDIVYSNPKEAAEMGLIKNIVFDNSKTQITKYLCLGTSGMPDRRDVIIPNTLDGKAVVAIGELSFHSARLNSIDFSQAKNLIEIKNYAFQYGVGGSSPISVDLSGATSLTTIGAGAFDNNSQLTYVKLPNSLVTLSPTAFTNSPKLTTIEIDKISGSIEGAPWGASSATVNWLRTQ